MTTSFLHHVNKKKLKMNKMTYKKNEHTHSSFSYPGTVRIKIRPGPLVLFFPFILFHVLSALHIHTYMIYHTHTYKKNSLKKKRGRDGGGFHFLTVPG